jgi:hypothetical protein
VLEVEYRHAGAQRDGEDVDALVDTVPAQHLRTQQLAVGRLEKGLDEPRQRLQYPGLRARRREVRPRSLLVAPGAQERGDALARDAEAFCDLFHCHAFVVERLRLGPADVRATGVERCGVLGEQLDDEGPVFAVDALCLGEASCARPAQTGDPLLDQGLAPRVVGQDAFERGQGIKKWIVGHRAVPWIGNL